MARSRTKATLINSFLTSLLLHAGLFLSLLMIKIDNHNIGFYVRVVYSTEIGSVQEGLSSTNTEEPSVKGLEASSSHNRALPQVLPSPPINTSNEVMLKKIAHQLSDGVEDIISEDMGDVLKGQREEDNDGDDISSISTPQVQLVQGETNVTFAINSGGLNNSKEGPFEMVFGSANGPSFLKMVKPEYPKLARRLGKEGKVLLKLHIDETGRLINLEIVERAGYGFDEAALSAIRASSFRPATKDGIPVPSVVYLPVRFVLETP